MKRTVVIFTFLIFFKITAANCAVSLNATPDKKSAADNNYAAFVSAINSNESIYIPGGTYYISINGSLVPKTGISIIGDGKDKTKLVFLSPSTSPQTVFSINNRGVTFDDLSIKVQGSASDNKFIFGIYNDGFTINHLEIDGNNTSQNSNTVHAFLFGDNNTENIRILNSDIHNVQRVILRPNNKNGLIKDVTVKGNNIHDLGMGGVQFNTPTKPANNIIITSNHFHNFNNTGGGEHIFVGTASGKNIMISNNTFSGSADNCIHIEENAENVTIKDNDCNADAVGVFIQDNDISGTSGHPHDISIVGNTFTDSSQKKT